MVVIGEMEIMKQVIKKYLSIKLWVVGRVLAVVLLVLMLSAPHKTMSRSVRSIDSLKRSLQEVSDEWPTMTTLLVYDSAVKEESDLKKIKKTFKRAKSHRRYKKYVDFVSINLNELDESESSELGKMIGLPSSASVTPTIYLFYNSRNTGESSGVNLKKEREVEDFVYDSFEGDILRIKRAREPIVERVVRYYDDYPRVSVGFGFGAPFSAHHYGSPYRHYGYRYGRGGWFGW
jgi:hypothetical protein